MSRTLTPTGLAPITGSVDVEWEIADLSGSDNHSGSATLTTANLTTHTHYTATTTYNPALLATNIFTLALASVTLLAGHNYTVRLRVGSTTLSVWSPWSTAVPIVRQLIVYPAKRAVVWTLTDTTGTDDHSGTTEYTLPDGVTGYVANLAEPLLAGHAYTLTLAVRDFAYPPWGQGATSSAATVTKAPLFLPGMSPSLSAVALEERILDFLTGFYAGGHYYEYQQRLVPTYSVPMYSDLFVLETQVKVDGSAWIPFTADEGTFAGWYPIGRHDTFEYHGQANPDRGYYPFDLLTEHQYSDGLTHTVTCRARLACVLYPDLTTAWLETSPATWFIGALTAEVLAWSATFTHLTFQHRPGRAAWTKARYGLLADPASYEYAVPNNSLVWVTPSGPDPSPYPPLGYENSRRYIMQVDGGAEFVYCTPTTYYTDYNHLYFGQLKTLDTTPPYWLTAILDSHPEWLDGLLHNVTVRVEILDRAGTPVSSYARTALSSVDFPLLADVLGQTLYDPFDITAYTHTATTAANTYFGVPTTPFLDIQYEPNDDGSYDYLGTPWATWRNTPSAGWAPAQWTLWNTWNNWDTTPIPQVVDLSCRLNGDLVSVSVHPGSFLRLADTFPAAPPGGTAYFKKGYLRLLGVPTAASVDDHIVVRFRLRHPYSAALSDWIVYQENPSDNDRVEAVIPAISASATDTAPLPDTAEALIPGLAVMAYEGDWAEAVVSGVTVSAGESFPPTDNAEAVVPGISVAAVDVCDLLDTAEAWVASISVTAYEGDWAEAVVSGITVSAADTTPLWETAEAVIPSISVVASEGFLADDVMVLIPAITALAYEGAWAEAVVPSITGFASDVIGTEAVNGYAVNLSTGAVTSVGYPFTRVITAHNTLYGLRNGTLYRVEGDADELARIHAKVRLAPLAAGTEQKRCKVVYLQGRLPDGVKVSTIVDETTQYDYIRARDAQAAFGTHKVKLGAVPWHSLSLVISNQDGGRFDLGGVEADVQTLSRKPKS